jgi:uncharacterized PurR-regulated membrane protein YhhQ (DUF165 family)
MFTLLFSLTELTTTYYGSWVSVACICYSFDFLGLVISCVESCCILFQEQSPFSWLINMRRM